VYCIDYFQAKTNEPVQGPLEASDPVLSKTIVWENSVVNWYHAYQIKPPITDPPTKLRVDKEYTYIIDRDACLVWLPELEEFDDKLHDMITDHQRHLKLSDILLVCLLDMHPEC